MLTSLLQVSTVIDTTTIRSGLSPMIIEGSIVEIYDQCRTELSLHFRVVQKVCSSLAWQVLSLKVLGIVYIECMYVVGFVSWLLGLIIIGIVH